MVSCCFILMLYLGLMKQKAQFHKGEPVYFTGVTYRVEKILFDVEEQKYRYWIKIHGHLFGMWIYEDKLTSAKISRKNDLNNFFRTLNK